MDRKSWEETFFDLSTPLVADACLRLGRAFRVAPPGIRPVLPGSRAAGRVLPVRHAGSVDLLFEAMGNGRPGDLLVVDNGGRSDEACTGDLLAMEARACGLSGILIWGCHRDTAELESLGFPVFSFGPFPSGPRRLDPRDPDALRTARFGDFTVSAEDVAFADGDGILFVACRDTAEILSTARGIRATERRQAEAIRAGRMLREQLEFREYLEKRTVDPSWTFRSHLRTLGGAVEE